MRSNQGVVDKTTNAGAVGTLMPDVAEVFKAVAHPVRAQILELLSGGELSIPQLCEGTGVKASHLSRHLNQLRGRRLILGYRTEGQLLYRVAYPEVTDLLEAAKAVLHAQVAANASRMNYTRPAHGAGLLTASGTASAPMPGVASETTFSEEQFAALETTLTSRSVIADACGAIVARTGCTLDEAAKQLIMTARHNDITLREAAAQELQNRRNRR